MRKYKIDFEEREGNVASENILTQAWGRGNHVNDSVWTHTANKLATAAFKCPGQTLNRRY